jgi:hypothetical protein
VSEWQPIETAPKDGTSILVWGVVEEGDGTPECAVVSGGWKRKNVRYYLIPWPQEDLTMCATHWMPLPEPPALSKAHHTGRGG